MHDGPVLVCTEGSLAGRVIPVTSAGLELGRAAENDVVIDEDGVSRFHARLIFDNGSLWLRDAGSRNGVFVNDKRVGDHRALKVGDRVRIAGSSFEVRWPGEVSKSKSSVKEAPPKVDPGPATGKKRWYWPFD